MSLVDSRNRKEDNANTRGNVTPRVPQPRWLTAEQVATALGFGLTKTKMLIAQRRIRSVKDGHHRRVLPEWVDDYIASKIEEYENA